MFASPLIFFLFFIVFVAEAQLADLLMGLDDEASNSKTLKTNSRSLQSSPSMSSGGTGTAALMGQQQGPGFGLFGGGGGGLLGNQGGPFRQMVIQRIKQRIAQRMMQRLLMGGGQEGMGMGSMMGGGSQGSGLLGLL